MEKLYSKKLIFTFVLIYTLSTLIFNVYYGDTVYDTSYDSEITSLARLYAALPASDYDADEVNAILDRIAFIPPRILDGLLHKGESIRLINGKLTDEPEYINLRGMVPRGWEGTGQTWDDVPGIGGNPVIVRIGYSAMGMGHGSYCLELHEISHRIDVLPFIAFSNREDFKAIWKEESGKLFTASNAYYFTDYPEEYFAEAYSMFLLNEDTYKSLRENAPKTLEYFRESGLDHPDMADLSLYQNEDKDCNVGLSKTKSESGFNSIDNTYSYTTDDNIYLNFGITNFGINEEQGFTTKVTVDNSDKLVINSKQLKEGQIERYWNIDIGKLLTGKHKITIAVDASDAVSELDEGNNIYSIIIDVKEGTGIQVNEGSSNNTEDIDDYSSSTVEDTSSAIEEDKEGNVNDSWNISSDKYTIDYENKVISDIKYGTSISEFIENIICNNESSVSIIDVNYNIVSLGLVKGSMLLQVTNTDGIIDEYSVSITVPFEVTDNDWAAPELLQALEYELVAPELLKNRKANITREQFCQLAVRLYEALSGDAAEPAAADTFSDTTDTDILKAYKLGITNGIGEGKFAPSNFITRQEISVMIVRTLKAVKSDIRFESSGVAAFADEGSIADWALESIKLCFKNNIVKGVGQGIFNPKGNTTIQEGVIMIKRAYENFEKIAFVI